MREAARVAQVRLDTDGRVRRALLRQSTPTRGPYPVGSYVYFYRAQVPPGAQTTYRWHGPARVIGVELRNPRRLADGDLPTEGGQPHSYWLRYGATVVLVAGEQLRFASEDELLAAHSIPQEILAPPYSQGCERFRRPTGLNLFFQRSKHVMILELQEESRVEAFVLGYLSRSLLWYPRRVSR